MQQQKRIPASVYSN